MAQKIKVENSLVDVGQVEYFSPVTATFELKNTGKKPLSIYKVDTGCNCSVAEYPTKAINTGDTFYVKVTYDSRLMGHFDKIIEVYSNATGSPTILEMSGVVVEEVDDFQGKYPFQLGSLIADCDTIDFQDVRLGEVLVRNFHIYNPTSKAVNPQIMHLPSYLKSEISPSTLAPSHSAVVTITLDSRFMRDFGRENTHVYLGANPGEKVSSNKQIDVNIMLLPAIPILDETEKALAPSLLLSTQEVKLPITGEKKKSATIDIQNTGKSRLSIYYINIPTEGFQLSLNKRSLAAGESAKLKITTDPKRLKNISEVSQIILITNDPDQPKVTIEVATE